MVSTQPHFTKITNKFCLHLLTHCTAQQKNTFYNNC